jgi:glucosyltransferase
MREVFVSICVLTYNHENYIRQALDGILMQETNFGYEIVIHDDASTDNTQVIIKDYAEKHPNIFKPLLQTQNQRSRLGGGMNARFNYPRAMGKYIALCDGDDYWTDPYKLQKQVDFLEANEAYGLVFTDCDALIEINGELVQSIFKNEIYKFKIDFLSHLIHPYFFAPCTWLIRKSCLREFKNLKNVTDGSYLIMLDILYKHKVYMIDEPTAVYRVRQESASHSRVLSKEYKWWKGVNKSQIEAAQLYKIDDISLELLKIHMYSFTLDKYAFEVQDLDYIEEARLFFNSINAYHIFKALQTKHFNNKEVQRSSHKIYKRLQSLLGIYRVLLNK